MLRLILLNVFRALVRLEDGGVWDFVLSRYSTGET